MRARAAKKDQRPHETRMSDLPNHVLTEILSRLPIKTLMAVKCVRKSWLNLVSGDTHFAALHHRRSQTEILLRSSIMLVSSTKLYLGTLQFQNNSVSGFKLSPLLNLKRFNVHESQHWSLDKYLVFVNSCNGFLFFRNYYSKSSVNLLICNPITGEFIAVPPPATAKKKCSSYGLGFSRKENRYKLLRIIQWWGKDPVSANRSIELSAEICTFENGSSWRSLGSLHSMFNGIIFGIPCVFLEGKLHFQCRLDTEEYIDCFDFDNEQFGKVPLPPPLYSVRTTKCIRELGGCLSVTRVGNGDGVCEIWVMKKYGVKDSWMKAFSVENPCFCQLRGPLVSPVNGETVLFHRDHHTLALYDSVLSTMRTLGSGRDPLEVIAYTPTLLPLKDALAGYEARVQKANSRWAGPGDVPDWWRPSGC